MALCVNVGLLCINIGIHILGSFSVCCSVNPFLKMSVTCQLQTRPDSKCVAVCCGVLRCVVACCSVLQCVAVADKARLEVCCSVLQCVAVCCSVLQRVAVCCSVLQCVAVADNARLEVRYRVGDKLLQIVAVGCR